MKRFEFLEQTHIDPKLAKAVIRQMGGWESFTESAEDVTQHGAAGGFHGFIYYKETTAFYNRNKAEIIEMAKEVAEEFGTNTLDFIASFSCLNGDWSADEVAQTIYGRGNDHIIKNALAWFALEEVCRSYSDITYNQ